MLRAPREPNLLRQFCSWNHKFRRSFGTFHWQIECFRDFKAQDPRFPSPRGPTNPRDPQRPPQAPKKPPGPRPQRAQKPPEAPKRLLEAPHRLPEAPREGQAEGARKKTKPCFIQLGIGGAAL